MLARNSDSFVEVPPLSVVEFEAWTMSKGSIPEANPQSLSLDDLDPQLGKKRWLGDDDHAHSHVDFLVVSGSSACT